MLNPENTKSIYFERMLEKQNMVTSYKAYWLKGIILEVIENQTSVISFSRLVTRMIVEAWYPQIQFKLNFGHQDQLGNVVQYLEATYHFVPWSFVLHDELWNLAPVFRNTNSSKGNRLPDLTQYFDEFGRLQYEAFLTMRQVKTKRKLMEDYVQLGGRLSSMEILNPDVQVSDEAFISTIKEAIVPIHQLAYNQGYDVWRYGL